VAPLATLDGRVAERISLIPSGGAGRHGTALAGLIAEVAPSARLLSIEAFADDPSDPGAGVSTTLALARALDAAIERKADVINLSVAGPRDPVVGRLVRLALSRGIVVVAAAGNEGPDAPPRYPAAYDGVIAVTATDARDRPYSGGAQGTHVAVAAPGVDVRTTVAEGVVGYVTGTSVSAAQVSGVAALLRERAPGLGSGEARRLLKETATPLPAGPGIVDAFAALSRATGYAGRR
jgi:subtilisin family serine protease